METNDFDEIIRRKLNQASMPVSDHGWESLSSQLPVRVKRRLRPYYWAASVAAIALLFFVLGDKYLSRSILQENIQVQESKLLSNPFVEAHLSEPLAVATISKPIYSEKTRLSITRDPKSEIRIDVKQESAIAEKVPENIIKEIQSESKTSPMVNQSPYTEEPYQLRIYSEKKRTQKQRGMTLALLSGNSPGASRGSSSVEKTFLRSSRRDAESNQSLPPLPETPMYYNHSMPVGIGLTIAKKISAIWSIESGVLYTQLNSTFSSLDGKASGRQELHYIGVPLNLIGNFYQYKRLSLYGATGGRVDFNVAGKRQGMLKGVVQETFSESVMERSSKFSLHLKVGVGYELIPHVQLFVEPGIGYYINNSSSLITIWKEYPLEFVLNLGVRTHF